MESVESLKCVSCGAVLHGSYCSQCGEQRVWPEQQTVRHFIADAFSDVANVDAKLYRTVRTLLSRPGQLTRDFMIGRRMPYVRPLQLFLLANLLYFLVQPLTSFSGYNTPLQSQRTQQFYSKVAGLDAVAQREIARSNTTTEAYTALYNAKSEIYAKSLILLMVPLFALVVALLHFWRRRPFLEHIVFATHYYAFDLIFISSLFLLLYSRVLVPWFYPALTRMPEGVLTSILRGFALELPTTPFVFTYLCFAMRRCYADGRVGAAVRAFLCLPLLLMVTVTYRFLLFWITVWSVR